MFFTIDYLNKGNKRQRKAYEAIKELNILNDLSEFTPLLCGTLPIGIDIEGSDLDIIMEVTDFSLYESKVTKLYGEMENFKIKRSEINDIPFIKGNFLYQGFEFELFGNEQPVHKQNAYLHMIIEHKILLLFPHLKKKSLS
jgi:hypothetical protein